MRFNILILTFICISLVMSCTDDVQTLASASSDTTITKSFEDILDEQTDYSKYISEEAERYLKLAESALEVSPSLALINYKFTLEKYYKDDKYSSQNYTIERKSQSGITSSQLRNEIIPDVKALAFKAAASDIFELLLLMKSLGAESCAWSQREMLELLFVMERIGNKEKADQIRRNLVYEDVSIIKSGLGSLGLIEYARWDMKAGKRDRAFENYNSVFDMLNGQTLTSLTSSMMKEIALLYIDNGNFDKAHIALKSLFKTEDKFSLNETGNETLEYAIENSHYDFALAFIKSIENEYIRMKTLSGILKYVRNTNLCVSFSPYLDDIHKDINEVLNGKTAYSGIDSAINLAICFHHAGQQEKANEIIDQFFGITRFPDNRYPEYVRNRSNVPDVILQEDSNYKPNQVYDIRTGSLTSLVQALVDMNQSERAVNVIKNERNFTFRTNKSKDHLPNKYSEIIRSCLIAGEIEFAKRFYYEFKNRWDEITYYHSKKIFTSSLKIAIAFNEYYEPQLAQESLTHAYTYLTATFPEDRLIYLGREYLHDLLNYLTDYETAFKIADYLDERFSTEKFAWKMAKQLFTNGQPDKAFEKGYSINSGSEGDLLSRIQSVHAKEMIIDGKLDEALEIANQMVGHNKSSHIRYIYKKVAIEYARNGDIQKSLTLFLSPTEKWSPAWIERFCLAIMHNLDANNPSEKELQELIDSVIPEILQLDYKLSLKGSIPKWITNESVVELARKAETSVLHCAYFKTIANRVNDTLIAELLTKYADGLIDLNMHDEARDALENAWIMWTEHAPQNLYPDDALSIAAVWTKLNDTEKAVGLIDEAARLIQNHGTHIRNNILDVAIAYRDAGRMDKAAHLIKNLSSKRHLFKDNSFEIENKLIQALWLAENGKYEIAWDSLANVELGYNDKIDYHEIPRIAIRHGEYEIASNLAQRIEKTSSRIYLLNNIAHAMIDNNVDFDIDSLYEKTLNELSKSDKDITKAYSFAYIAKVYYDAGKHDKARELANQALESVNKILDDKNVSRTLDIVSDTLIHCGMPEESKTLKSKIKNNPYRDPAGDTEEALLFAKNGEFEKAIDFILNLECLYDPSATMTAIARHMVSAKEYDLAFDALELGTDRTRIKMCPRQGCWSGGGKRTYSDFPILFLDAGRFDLALKSLNFLGWSDSIVPAMMKIELEIRNTNYELTDGDKRSLRRLIHTDPYYIR